MTEIPDFVSSAQNWLHIRPLLFSPFLPEFCIYCRICKPLWMEIILQPIFTAKVSIYSGLQLGVSHALLHKKQHTTRGERTCFFVYYYTDSKPKITIMTPTSVSFCSVPVAPLSNFKVWGDISTARDLSSALQKPSAFSTGQHLDIWCLSSYAWIPVSEVVHEPNELPGVAHPFPPPPQA